VSTAGRGDAASAAHCECGCTTTFLQVTAPCAVRLFLTTRARAIQVARQEGATLADLQAALQTFDRQYAATAAGPDKWRRHAEFMRDVYGAAVRDVAERSSQRSRDEARDAAARAAQAEASLLQVHLQPRCPSWCRQCWRLLSCAALDHAHAGVSHSKLQLRTVHIAVSSTRVGRKQQV